MKICMVDGCEKPVRVESLLCSMHFSRKQRKGDVGGPNPERGNWIGQVCDVDGCGQAIKAKGFCAKHYDYTKYHKIYPGKIDKMKENGCFVCGSFSRLTVDHDHSCCPTNSSCEKCIRGILCHKCNTAAGLLDDDANRMLALASYIMSNKDVLLNVS